MDSQEANNTLVDDVLLKLTQQLEIRQQQELILNRMLEDKKIGHTSILTNEEYKVLNTPITSDPDVLALILDAKSEGQSRTRRRELEERDNYQPFLLHTSDSIETFQQTLLDQYTKKEPFHYDLIIRDPKGVHSTPVQIHSNGNEVRVFSIDAAGDDSNQEYIDSIGSNLNAPIYYRRGGIQYSDNGCWLFSVKDLNKLSNMSEREKKEIGRTSVRDYKEIPEFLPPQFLSEIQSKTSLDQYLNSTTKDKLISDKKGNDLLDPESDAYKYFVTYTVAKSSQVMEFSPAKTQNLTILAAGIKYAKAAMSRYHQLIEKGGKEAVLKTIQSRQDSENHNTYSEYENHNLYKRDLPQEEPPVLAPPKRFSYSYVPLEPIDDGAVSPSEWDDDEDDLPAKKTMINTKKVESPSQSPSVPRNKSKAHQHF